MNNPEILAPAGTLEGFKAAINGSADAVYLGGNMFGARAFAGNLSKDELLYAIDYAHLKNKKLYLTVNTLLTETEINDRLYDYIEPFYRAGLDAVIVQDMGVASFIHNTFSKLDIHASTQMTITNADSLYEIKDLGITRVVPARELSIEELQRIKKEHDIELETFVHGALCYSYSGQCLLSQVNGGRSGNRGQCAQPCRLKYAFEGKEGYLLSPKDICLLTAIPELITAGIDSFKIEGRMKKPYYAAFTAYTYRKWVDHYLEHGSLNTEQVAEDKIKLADLYNRGGFTTGYYFMHNGKEMMTTERPNHFGVQVCEVASFDARSMELKATDTIYAHDVIELREGNNVIYEFTTGSDCPSGKTFQMNYMKGSKIRKGLCGYRIRNNTLIEHIEKDIIGSEVKPILNMSVTLKCGEKACIKVSDGTFSSESYGDIVSEATNKPVDKDRVISAVSALGESGYSAGRTDCDVSDNIFIPIGALKALRREAVEQFNKEKLEHYRRTEEIKSYTPGHYDSYTNTTITIRKVLYKISDLEKILNSDVTCILINADREIINHYDAIKATVKEHQKEIGIIMPTIFRSNVTDKPIPTDADIYIVKDQAELYYLDKIGIPKEKIVLDHNIYIWNTYSYDHFKKKGYSHFTLNREQSPEELLSFLSSENICPSDFELIVTGRKTVMTTANCLYKTTGKCLKHEKCSILSASDGKDYPIINNCRYCYNTIYDSTETDLTKYIKDLKSVGVNTFQYL